MQHNNLSFSCRVACSTAGERGAAVFPRQEDHVRGHDNDQWLHDARTGKVVSMKISALDKGNQPTVCIAVEDEGIIDGQVRSRLRTTLEKLFEWKTWGAGITMRMSIKVRYERAGRALT
jgi:hypothetical protein